LPKCALLLVLENNSPKLKMLIQRMLIKADGADNAYSLLRFSPSSPIQHGECCSMLVSKQQARDGATYLIMLDSQSLLAGK